MATRATDSGRAERMNPQHWQRVRDLFEAAVELPQPQWAAWLQGECADAGVRAEVLAMLDADARHGVTTGLLERAPDLLDDYSRQAASARLGQRFGAWRLLRVLAEGGMGTVYLAERVEGGFVQQAALKLVRGGSGSVGVMERLAAERQILAGLEHPNIARLLDGGMGASGEPFLAMEYVEGTDLCSYCDGLRLDVPSRLRLLLQVCEAVAYAHARLVVHRDLKPANVLVSAAGEVKLLDFGIARLIEADGAAAATQLQQRVYTPGYAAPEQISGALTTTAVDVHALGVLLFELISGRRPYATRGLSVAAIEQQVLHCEPARPSGSATERPSGVAATPDAPGPTPLEETEDPATQRDRLAQLRGTTPAQLRRQLRGDLDAIALRALRKQPQERYGSVQLFADDLRAHLQQRPVSARRGSLRYALGRFLRRNVWAVGSASFAVLALLLGLGAALWQAEAARRDGARSAGLHAAAVRAGRPGGCPRPRSQRARAAADRKSAHPRCPGRSAGRAPGAAAGDGRGACRSRAVCGRSPAAGRGSANTCRGPRWRVAAAAGADACRRAAGSGAVPAGAG
jgi:serine/threonine-protein kinase